MAATASHPSPVPALRGDEEALYRAHHIYLCGSSPTTSAPALR
jgi:hypothetical protein